MTTTVRDLKTFIDAVEFASDVDEWTPSPKQWKRIRSMINELTEEPTAAPRPMYTAPEPTFPIPDTLPDMRLPVDTAHLPSVFNTQPPQSLPTGLLGGTPPARGNGGGYTSPFNG
jgi:hypothetical protein